MNYIAEINCFEQWLETNHLPVASQLLWYKLMALCNRCGWAEWITVDNWRLMAIMQMKREATFIEVRNKLIEAGRLEYRKGKKGSPNQYKIIPFTFKSVVQSEVNTVVNSVVQSEVQTVVQTVDINKHRLNKNNNSALTPEQKSDLVKKYGESIVEKYIAKASTYNNCCNIETISKWIEDDKSKPLGKKNKFNDFPQRAYDYDELEKQLIGNNKEG